MAVKKYENETLTILCPQCKEETTEKVDQSKIVFDEGLNEYRNLAIDCKQCADSGKTLTVYVNMNLPELDEMEIDVMEELAPAEEVQARRAIRDLMWKHRPDLKGKDRATERRGFIEKNAQQIEKTRQEIGARKAARALRNPDNG